MNRRATRGPRAPVLGDRNDRALDAARTYPDRFAVMGRLALYSDAWVLIAFAPVWRLVPASSQRSLQRLQRRIWTGEPWESVCLIVK
jgi:hypothetical protein